MSGPAHDPAAKRLRPAPTQPAPSYLVALDVEAAGQGVLTHFLIQVGLSLVDVQKGEVMARFSSYVAQPAGTEWEERCVREFWATHPEQWERAKRGVAAAPPAEKVRAALLAWVDEHVKHPEITRLVSDTSGYDVSWLDHLLGDRSHLYLFSNKDGVPVKTDVLDVGSWYLGLGGELDPDASSKAALRRALGVEEEPDFGVPHDHDAANDAANIGLRAAWALRELARGA